MQTGDLSDVDSKRGETIENYPSIMNADLGLFSQLLQMVDGDWSDSIKGICDHIRQRFKALGVSLNVFDKNYDEFIYFTYSTTRHSETILSNNGIDISSQAALDVIKSIYEVNKKILEPTVFKGDDLLELAKVYSNFDKERAVKVLKELNLQTISTVPLMNSNSSFKCSIHIFTNRDVNDNDKFLINEYSAQLNIALEIVFLVRELYIKATHDSLTKLFNHKQGEILLDREMIRVQRNKHSLSIAMLDLDHFKKCNDRFGHHAGDEVLRYISKLLSESLRKCDIISRYGGEEFLLVLPDTDLNKAVEVTKRLKHSLQNHVFNFSDTKYSITASFGVIEYNTDRHLNHELLIGEADQYLYRAKHEGRNRICFNESQDKQ
jgi:diguanylate cyclase (GGDEF)-like protein